LGLPTVSGKPRQAAVFAGRMNELPETISMTVDDPWFGVQDDFVAIARNDI
jgi:hypothetical protein